MTEFHIVDCLSTKNTKLVSRSDDNCDGGINKVQLRNSNSFIAYQRKYKGECDGAPPAARMRKAETSRMRVNQLHTKGSVDCWENE
jgi:hypothetical protein